MPTTVVMIFSGVIYAISPLLISYTLMISVVGIMGLFAYFTSVLFQKYVSVFKEYGLDWAYHFYLGL